MAVFIIYLFIKLEERSVLECFQIGRLFSVEYKGVHLLYLQKLNDLGDVVKRCVAAFSHTLGLFYGFFNTDQIALVFVLAEHTGLKLGHLAKELIL